MINFQLFLHTFAQTLSVFLIISPFPFFNFEFIISRHTSVMLRHILKRRIEFGKHCSNVIQLFFHGEVSLLFCVVSSSKICPSLFGRWMPRFHQNYVSIKQVSCWKRRVNGWQMEYTFYACICDPLDIMPPAFKTSLKQ